ncbi:spartin-like isoform X2 [Hyperolius riggenbachi]
MENQELPEMQENALIRSIEEEYRKAFLYINKGLFADENGYKEDARNFYRQGQEHLTRGLGVSLQGPQCIGPAWDSARHMQVKMKETLQNMNTRLNILQQSMTGVVPDPSAAAATPLYPTLPTLNEKPVRPPVPNRSTLPAEPVSTASGILTNNGSPVNHILGGTVAPPVYTPQATDGHFTVSYGTESGEQSFVGEEFYSMAAQPLPVQSLGVDAEELILIPRGVQIFFVTPDGEVSAPSYPGYLRIIKFMDTSSELAQSRPPAFLQVCDWLYPLMCTESPVLRSNTGVYMFPDLMSQAPSSYVGVVLSAELPAADLEMFDDLLSQLSDLRIQPGEALGEIDLSHTVHVIAAPEPGPEAKQAEDVQPWSEKVAQGLREGASWLSSGLAKGAEMAGNAIHKGGTYLREQMTPEDTPREVNPTVAKGLHVAKQATSGAVKVSHFLVDGLCSITRGLSPHVKKHGSRLIPQSLKADKDGKSPLDGAVAVVTGGVQGFVTVWQGLENAGKNVAKSVATETVHTVKYKYGEKAGDASDDAVSSVINIGATAFNIDHMLIKTVVKTTKEGSRDEEMPEVSRKEGDPQ